MMQIILGTAGCVCLFALPVIFRNKSAWPREGHGHTYFVRTSSQNW